MTLLWTLLLLLLLLGCLLMTVLGLPGNWAMVAVAALYAYLLPPEVRGHLGWPVVGALAFLAALGEVIELVTSSLGVARRGGTRRGAVLALGGSMLGALLGLVVGLPVPLVGQLLAVVLFASLGAMAGAMLGEHSAGRGLEQSWRVGQAAFWGRLLGTLGKTFVGALMAAVAMLAALF